MNKELQQVANVLFDLNDDVKKSVFSLADIQRLGEALDKIDLRTSSFNSSVHKLLSMSLALNNDKVINLLIAMHGKLSRLILCINVIGNATRKMVRNYEDAWHKVYSENKKIRDS